MKREIFSFTEDEQQMIHQIEQLFNADEIYDTSFIKDELERHNISFPNAHNPPGLSYNRWNKGMTKPRPLFEWISRGRLKFLGPSANYNGPVYNIPKDEHGSICKIGEFINGEFWWSIDIDSFDRWIKSNEEGTRVSNLGSHITYKYGQIKQQRYLTDENTTASRGSYLPLKIDSNMGGQLYLKEIGHRFDFTTNHGQVVVVELIEID